MGALTVVDPANALLRAKLPRRNGGLRESKQIGPIVYLAATVNFF